MGYAKMKSNKRFIKIDSPITHTVYFKAFSVFILLAFSKVLQGDVFFFEESIPARTLFIIYSNKIMMPNTSFLATAVTLPSAGVAILARLTIADHSCLNKRSVERLGKVKNADKAKKCNTTCDLIPLSEINTKQHKTDS